MVATITTLLQPTGDLAAESPTPDSTASFKSCGSLLSTAANVGHCFMNLMDTQTCFESVTCGRRAAPYRVGHNRNGIPYQSRTA
jgi:hypothetical protein